MHDDQRRNLDQDGTTRKNFKVFFNKLYAAAFLASILFDADYFKLSRSLTDDFRTVNGLLEDAMFDLALVHAAPQYYIVVLRAFLRHFDLACVPPLFQSMIQ